MNEQIEQWIPWYVNGTLGTKERAAMDRYLATDADARAEIALLSHAATAMKSSVGRVPTDRGLDRALARIRAEKSPHPAKRNAAKPAGLLGALRTWFNTSWTQPAFALALVVIGAQSVFLMRDAPETMLMRGSNSATVPAAIEIANKAFLRVNFKPTATEGEIRVLMAGGNANFVAGPGENGEYTLSVAEKDAVKTLAIFAASNIVATASSAPAPR
jgi:anti-sigma-K factor RskA